VKARVRSRARGGLFDQMAVPITQKTVLPPAPIVGCACDYAAAVRKLSKADEQLGRLIRRVGPCQLKVETQVKPYGALLEAIVYQQLNGKAAAAILKRVKAVFPGRPFPRPADILGAPEETLRAAGLSRGKLAAIRDLAQKALDGVVPTARAIARLPDEEIVERLTAIRGIGRWTVEMLLLFSMGRPDVLPATDYGIRQGYALTFGAAELPKPAELIQHGERWKPYRSVASWYLWRAVELSRSRPD
jgi:DNA-3-methyladenine glycosylase II